jgi:hypothetical protein
MTGLVIAPCLLVVTSGVFRGVACNDFPITDAFQQIVDFRLGELSYAFLVDGSGHVLLHPLLPQPSSYKLNPNYLYVDLESVENVPEARAIKQGMMRSD